MTRGSEELAFEEFLRLWESFRQESARVGTAVVVEGERDRDALRALGAGGRIVLVHRGQRLGALANDLAESVGRVIVLTDWDAPGGQIAQRLKGFLASGPVELDLEFRRRLAIVLKGEVVHVEGLFGWARRMAERSGAPIEHFLTAEGSRSGPD